MTENKCPHCDKVTYSCGRGPCPCSHDCPEGEDLKVEFSLNYCEECHPSKNEDD